MEDCGHGRGGWCDRKDVLIKPFQIKPGLNKIMFTKCDYPSLLMQSQDIRSYPMATHGAVGAYAVPLKDFEYERDNQLRMELV